MPGINVKQDTKAEFDELNEDGLTHDEFTKELLAAYKRDGGEIVNTDAIVDEVVARIAERVASEIEVASYRGVTNAIEETELVLPDGYDLNEEQD